MTYFSYLASPAGLIELTANDQGLTSLHFVDKQSHPENDNPITQLAKQQLSAYFANELTEFDIPLDPKGTPFQQQVWQALLSIPCGKMVSYRDIANQIGNPKAVRAVGAANGKNPISIIVPCHRVIGSNGQLTGYAGGLERKAWLLQHEVESFSLS